MLTLSRKIDETIHIFPADDIPPGMTVEELFANGSIIIKLRAI